MIGHRPHKGVNGMELFKLLGTIAVNNEQANKALDETADTAEKSSEKTQGALGKIGSVATRIAGGIMTAGAALGTAFVTAVEGTRQYREQMGLLETAFQTAGHSSDEARQTYSDMNAVLGDTEQAVEASQHLALLADDEADLSEMTHTLTGVYATFGQSLPLEGLAEGIVHSSALGEVQGSLADALEWSGITVESFNEQLAACTTEEERQDLILRTLNETYSTAADKYKETNAEVMAANRAQERLNNAFAELGRIGEPIMTAIKEKVAEMVTAAVPHIENLIQKVKYARKWMQENKNTVDAWKAAIIGITVSIGSFLLVLKWGTILGAATKAVKACRAAILLFNAALRANPIGLVVSLLAGLVAAFVYLWNNNKGFRQFWIDLWAKIKSTTQTAINAVKTKFGDFKDMVANAKQRFEDLRESVADKVGKARDAVKKAVDKIKGFFDFDWSLPKLKMPTFSIKGKFDLNPPSVPKLGIKWNAEGGIFDKPTIFDTRLGLQGVGESGAEAIAPIDTLTAYIREAVRAENEGVRSTYIQQTDRMMEFLRRIIPQEITLDSGVLVGELTPAIDGQLSSRWQHIQRGNTR